jgi:hypothetical protein
VPWVEPVFRVFFRENGIFFRGAKCGEKMALFSRSEKLRKIVLFAVRNAAKNCLVLSCELGRACFLRFFSRKMELFFAERKAAKNGALLLAKNGEKWHFFFAERNAAKNGALLLAKYGEKWRFPKEI